MDIQCGQGVFVNDIQQDCCAFIAFEAMEYAFVTDEGTVDDGYRFARVEYLLGRSLKSFVIFMTLELFHQFKWDPCGNAVESHQMIYTIS